MLWLPDLQPRWTPIEFLIDTGASHTALHPLDAIRRVQIAAETLAKPSMWPVHETPSGIGGSALYFVVEAHYAFLKDYGDWHQLSAELRIAQATGSNLTLPSLLGWDLLQHLPLATNWQTRTISLG